MTGIDRYSGLIVSMHRTGLWRQRYGTIAYPTAFNPRALGPEIEAFIARHEAWQEEERNKRDAAEVWTNYRLLQVWDLLGLYFCCRRAARGPDRAGAGAVDRRQGRRRAPRRSTRSRRARWRSIPIRSTSGRSRCS